MYIYYYELTRRYTENKANDDLYWNWQYTKNVSDETQKSYKDSHKKFIKDTKLPEFK